MWSPPAPNPAALSSKRKCVCSRRRLLLTALILFLLTVVLHTYIFRYGSGTNGSSLLPVLKNARVQDSSTSADVKQASEPPGTEPPGTEPPGTEPPGTELPGTEPPGTEPPAGLHRDEEEEGPAESSMTVPPPVTHRTKEACRPKSHVVFLKTHKTGSSTVLNIVYRYGDNRNLTFALPGGTNNRFFYPSTFRSEMVAGFSRRSAAPYHIICNHMRFNKTEVAKVMPEDSFYFSILRHPVAMMESMFVYFNGFPAFPRGLSLAEVLDRSLMNQDPALNDEFTHNNLAFDLGQDNRVTADAADLEQRAAGAIAAIQRDFHLILINEYFDESMVLLRRALCWSLEDVVSFRLNGRSDAARNPVSPENAEKIKRWNALDWRIYLHFNATFWQQVESAVGGEEQLQREVSELRELQARLSSTCLSGGRAVAPGRIRDAAMKPFQGGAAVVLGYNLNTHLDPHTATKCRRFIMPENLYLKELFTKQFPERAGQH